MKTVKSDALNATYVFINIVETAPTVLSHTQYANIFTWSEDLYTMETVEYPVTGEQRYMSTEQLTNEIDNINDHVKSEGPIDVDGVKGRIQQKLLRIMSSVQLSNDITSLKQLDKSLNAAENLYISLNKSKSLTHLHTVTNAPANKKIDVQKKFYSTTKKRK